VPLSSRREVYVVRETAKPPQFNNSRAIREQKQLGYLWTAAPTTPELRPEVNFLSNFAAVVW